MLSEIITLTIEKSPSLERTQFFKHKFLQNNQYVYVFNQIKLNNNRALLNESTQCSTIYTHILMTQK